MGLNVFSEERDERTHFHYGFNMPGYLPDSEPYITFDWDGAYDALMFDIDADLEHLTMVGTLSDAEADAVEIDIAKTARFGEDFDYAFQGSAFHYWIEKCNFKDCLTLEDRLAMELEYL